MRRNPDVVPDNCAYPGCGVLIAVHPRRIGSKNYCPVHKGVRRRESWRDAARKIHAKAVEGRETKRCVDCGVPVEVRGNQHEPRCPTHAAERKREAARDRQRKRKELLASIATDPRNSSFRWRIAKCDCGASFVQKSGNHVRCESCAAEAEKRAQHDRRGHVRSQEKCASCGLNYRPKPGEPPDCAVCLYEKSKSSGQPVGELRKKAWRLREDRIFAAVPKPDGGRCIVCGAPSGPWYCSKDHMRTGYKLLVAAEEERRDLASAMETETPGPVWDPTLGHKGAYRPNRKRRRRRRWARVF